MSGLYILMGSTRTVTLNFPLRLGQYVLGRSAECDYVVSDASVSRRHAELRVAESGVSVTDLGSRNGTFVNDARVNASGLEPGQRLRLGAATFLLTQTQTDLEGLGPDGETDGPPTCGKCAADGLAATHVSASQRRILDFLLEGMAEKQIAARLDLSRHTVHNHVRAIYRAYGVHSRSELFAQFFERGPRETWS
jgi:DNA-binding CsgD family transcriptional regulator